MYHSTLAIRNLFLLGLPSDVLNHLSDFGANDLPLRIIYIMRIKYKKFILKT